MKITFVRHGNTNKAENDLDRRLTEIGVQQARERRQALLNPKFDLVLSSIAPRARDTAAIIAGIDMSSVITLEALYLPKDPCDKKAIDDMFDSFGYAPLRAYRNADVTNALVRYGKNGAAAIFYAISAKIEKDVSIDNILVVGHAVLLNAIVAHMVGDTNIIIDISLGEAKGLSICIDIDDDGLTTKLIQ